MMVSLGKRIRELRLKKGMTQIELAKGICTPSMISQIESDRARPSYKMLYSIAERLDTPMEKLLMDTDMNLEHTSAYKFALALIGTKDYQTALPILRGLLNEQRSQISSLDIQMAMGECLLHVGQFEESEKCLNEVLELAMLRMEEQKLARVCKLLGDLEEARKRYLIAAFHWKKAIHHMEQMDEQDAFMKAEILHRLGDAHLKMRSLDEAKSCYDQAAMLYESMGKLGEIGNVYVGLSENYKMMKRWDISTEYSEKAIGIFKSLEDQVLILCNQVTRAGLLADNGCEADAEAMLRDCIVQFQRLGKYEEMGTTLVELAKLMVSLERWQEAEDACKQAQNLLHETHLCQAWILRLRAKVELSRGNVKMAITRYENAANAFLQHREIGEYGDTMFELSCAFIKVENYGHAYAIMEQVRNETHCELQRRGIVL